jgi:hypothetical protein
MLLQLTLALCANTAAQVMPPLTLSRLTAHAVTAAKAQTER